MDALTEKGKIHVRGRTIEKKALGDLGRGLRTEFKSPVGSRLRPDVNLSGQAWSDTLDVRNCS